MFQFFSRGCSKVASFYASVCLLITSEYFISTKMKRTIVTSFPTRNLAKHFSIGCGSDLCRADRLHLCTYIYTYLHREREKERKTIVSMQQVIRHQTKRTNDWVLTGTPFDEEQVPPQQSQSQKYALLLFLKYILFKVCFVCRIAPTLEFFQQVRDENGRQRLHGAFKGGFSAGYFNSVGSKEGW